MKEKLELKITELQKSRIRSDAALLQDGAEYVLDKPDAEPRLEVTELQRLMGKKKKHMYEWTEAEAEETLLAMFQKYKIELGDMMSIQIRDNELREDDAKAYARAGMFAGIKNGHIYLDVKLSFGGTQDVLYSVRDVKQIIIWRDNKRAMVLDC